jgi:A/G-specific adenine glycosylase
VPDAASIAAPLLAWYDVSGRSLPWRGIGDPYRIWVSELMLQQTRVDTVLRHYDRFLERFGDLETLAAAELDEVLAAWSGLGYYRRARNLHAGAQRIVDELGGVFPREPELLATLPGVGRYTVGAILSSTFDAKLPILDGNVVRVLSRLFEVEGAADRAPVKRRLWALAEAVLPDRRPGDFNQALMDLGATVCLPRTPDCDACPLAEHCAAKADGRQLELPAAPRRTKVRHVDRVAVLLLGGDSRFEVVRRPPTGLLAGLWELPSAELDAGGSPAAVAASLAGVEVEARGIVEHRFSHRHWTVHVFAGRSDGRATARDGQDASRRRVTVDELGDLGLPTVSRKAIEVALEGATAPGGSP